ncbi:hypothetical protein ACWC4C_05485 [Streptomyces olivaceoviridis]|nr:hypothetical protein SHJG_1429 [Streptomyces hygroscopicus subsp. jinggangensis 5008]AGF60928.1 hypothetical protein SHJGH_1262 [Streptomyces hygroscopicus subsp. jinggangensis TL01]
MITEMKILNELSGGTRSAATSRLWGWQSRAGCLLMREMAAQLTGRV